MEHDDSGTGTTSRRAFLTGAAGVAGAAIGASVLGAAGVAQASTPKRVSGSTHPPPHPHRAPHAHYRRGLFEDAKSARVTLLLDGSPVTLTIRDINPLGVAEAAPGGSHLWHNAFSVTMTGPVGTDIPQGTYPVTINGKRFDLFVVPLLRTTATPVYEAIINRAYYRRARG